MQRIIREPDKGLRNIGGSSTAGNEVAGGSRREIDMLHAENDEFVADDACCQNEDQLEGQDEPTTCLIKRKRFMQMVGRLESDTNSQLRQEFFVQIGLESADRL